MDKYDENITENNFFIYLKTKHSDILDEAICNKYIICIPKADIVQNISLDLILDHILIPLEDTESNKDYITKKKNELILGDGQLKSKKFEDRKLNILFEETFYVENGEKYKVVCVDDYISGLFKDDYVANVHNELLLNNQTLKHFRNVNDFVEHIVEFTGPFMLIDEIDTLITSFLSIPFSKVNPPKPDFFRRNVNVIFLKSLHHIHEIMIRLKDYERLTLRMCIESYILHSLHNVLFQYSITEEAEEDEKFNRLLHSLKEISHSKFDIRIDNLNCILSAKYELAAINNFKSPFGKLQCIRKAIDCFESNSTLTSDEILSILVFTIIKCNVSNWFANLTYIKNYSFTLESSDEYSFILSSFEAALMYIHSEDIQKKEGYEDISNEIFFYCNEEISFQLDTFNPKSQNYRSSVLYSLYDNIRKQNLTGVKTVFETKIESPKLIQTVPESELCHPLCMCSKCKLVIKETTSSELSLEINYKDENLMTPLHIAAWYGSANIVEYLLSEKANYSCQNVAGMTPLHIAAYKGHQMVLLLLLNAGSGSDINVADKEGNTALLLACKAGHDSCVKALIFYAESIGFNVDFKTKNVYGETALHLASYWGYLNLVKFLVMQPSVCDCLLIKNMRNQTPYECAHNEIVAIAIKRAEGNVEESMHTNLLLLNFDDENKNITSNTNANLQGDDSLTENISLDVTKVEESPSAEMLCTQLKILDAISAGDTDLACLYLEINENTVQNKKETTKCHPLCQCINCSNASAIQMKNNSSMINFIGEENYGPLHLAVIKENLKLCQILLQNGANPQLVTKSVKQSCLHLAVEKENLEILNLLIKFNSDVNYEDLLGNTPLHLCCIKGWKEGVVILLESGAKFSLNNKDGSSPKEEADKHGHIEIVGILVRKMSEQK